MPEINLDIFARLHQATLRRTEKDAKERFEKIGRMARDEITHGVEDAAPRVRRAMLTAADAITDVERRKRDLNKITDEQNASLERELKLEGDIAQMRRRSSLVAAANAQAEDEFRKSRVKQEEAAQRVLELEDQLDDRRRKHAPNVARLAQDESRLKDIRLQGKAAAQETREFDKSLQPLRKLVKQETAEITQATFELNDAREALKQTTFDATKAESGLNDVTREREQLVKDMARSEGDLDKTRQTLSQTDRELLRVNEDIVRSNDKRLESNRRLAEAEAAEDKRREKANGNGRKKRGASGVVGNMLTDLPFVPSGPAGAAMGSAVIVTLASAAEAAVTASQALVTLPAIAAAGAAAIGTLAMGFNGLGDALGHMDDPKKWAEDLQSLSPAAQQAALEIKYLVDGPLGDLQDATQETLLGGVAEQLHTLTDNLLPEAQTLTQGLSQSFNSMFDNAVGQLISAESQESIGNVVNNIVTAFQNLEPAVAPFISAITKITETGSSFLPGFADAITNAANSFNYFITKTQQDGSLSSFIQKGIDAAVAFKDVIWDVGQRIYETFGNKSPDEFKQTLDSMVDAAFAVAGAIVGISHVVNELLKFIQPIADSLGGWENLVKVAGAAFLAYKTIGVITNLTSMAGLLGSGAGGIGAGLAAIPALASTAGLALAALALPAWIVELIKKAPYVAPDAAAAPTPNGPAYWDWANSGRKSPTDIYAGGGLAGYLGNVPASQGGMGPEPGTQVGPPPTGPPPPPPGSLDVGTYWTGGPGLLPGPTPPPGPGAPPPGPGAGLPGYTPFDVPSPPPEGSKSAQLDEIMSTMDPSQFMPSGPIGSPGMPAMPGGMPGGMPGMAMPGGVPNLQDTGSVASGPLSQQAAALVMQMFGDQIRGPIGGSRDGNTAPGTHDAGLSIDIPIGPDQMGLGDQINAFLQQNAASLGMKYSIWRDKGQQADGGTFNTPGHQNHIDAHFQPGGANGQPPLMYGNGDQPYAKPGMGYYDVDQTQVFKKQNRLDREGNDVGQARMKLAALKQIGATEQEIREAEQNVKEQEQAYDEAYLDLVDAQNGNWKKVNGQSKLEGIGPGLDADFGAGKGLAGIADNLVRFTATMGMAPVLGALSQMAQGSGGGYGLMGIMGAQNIANGMSPLGMHPLGGQQQMPYGANGSPTASSPGPGNMANFGPPGSKQANANMIYQQAISRGYNAQEAQAIVAYAIGESGLDAGKSGGQQGGKGPENEVLGLFQQKPAFAKEGGIDPSMRTDPVANTYAYLNQLEKNRQMPIEQALPATSGGGPLASDAGAQPQSWNPLMSQAGQLLGGPGAVPPVAGGVPPIAGGVPPIAGGVPPIAGEVPPMAGGMTPGMGMPQGMPMSQPQAQLPGTTAGQEPVGKAAGAGGWQPNGGGGISAGGGLMAAATTAASGLDVMAPGAGQAAKTGMELINRGIKQAGQYASIGVSGLLETFGLSDSVIGDPSKSWIGRAAAGVAGMAPAVPTSAGQTKAPVQPQEHEGQQGQQGQQGPTVHIENFTQAENRNGQQAANDLAYKAHGAWTK